MTPDPSFNPKRAPVIFPKVRVRGRVRVRVRVRVS